MQDQAKYRVYAMKSKDFRIKMIELINKIKTSPLPLKFSNKRERS